MAFDQLTDDLEAFVKDQEMVNPLIKESSFAAMMVAHKKQEEFLSSQGRLARDHVLHLCEHQWLFAVQN